MGRVRVRWSARILEPEIRKLNPDLASNYLSGVNTHPHLNPLGPENSGAFTYLPLLRMTSYTVSLTWYFLYHSHRNDGKYVKILKISHVKVDPKMADCFIFLM